MNGAAGRIAVQLALKQRKIGIHNVSGAWPLLAGDLRDSAAALAGTPRCRRRGKTFRPFNRA